MIQGGLKTLVFEPFLSGHRAHYVAVHTRALLELGAEVILAVPENAREQPEGKVFLDDVLSHVEHLPLPAISSHLTVLATAKAKLQLLRESVQRSNPHHCFVPYADGLSQAWGMMARPKALFPTDLPIEGLVMRELFAYPGLGWKRTLFAKLSSFLQRRAAWTKLHHLDPLAFQKIKNRPNASTEHCLIPDIIGSPPPLEKRIAKQRLGLDPDRYVITCPGPVRTSKGSKALMAATDMLDDAANVQLALIGKHSVELKQFAKRYAGNSKFHLVDRFATAEEFDLLFSAADMIAVCYPQHFGSASILLRAAAAGKNIIASDYGWIGWATKTFHLGEVCDANSPEAIRRLIENHALQNVDHSSAQARAAESFLRYHTEKNHIGHWTRLFRQRLGMEKDDDLIDFGRILQNTKEMNE